MTIVLLILAAALIIVLVAVAYRLGFKPRRRSNLSRLAEVKAQSLLAERALHDLTRDAFIAMALQVERHTSRGAK